MGETVHYQVLGRQSRTIRLLVHMVEGGEQDPGGPSAVSLQSWDGTIREIAEEVGMPEKGYGADTGIRGHGILETPVGDAQLNGG